MALSYLDAVFGDNLWDLPIPFVRKLNQPNAELVLRATRQGVNSSLTSSCGRLFDAVAALVGLRQTATYEGQAAMELEMAMRGRNMSHPPLRDTHQMVHLGQEKPGPWETPNCLFDNSTCQSFVLDPAPLIRTVVDDIQAQVPLPVISRRFHQALVQSLAGAVARIANDAGLRQVVLSGGCFQNLFLQRELTTAIEELDLSVFVPQLLPPNDGGLSLGQIMVASAITARRLEESCSASGE